MRTGEIAALRERIQAVEEQTDRLGMMAGLAGFELLAFALGLAAVIWVRPLRFWLILAAAFGGGLAGFLIRYPLAAAYRWRQHRRLRRELAALTPDQRAALFDLMEDDPLPSARRLLAPFAGERRART